MATKQFLGGVVVLALGVMAASMSGAGAQEYRTTDGVAFANLTPGNRIIARALYEAQSQSTGGLIPGWTLEQLAAAKRSGLGWDAIFLKMKGAGLLKAEALEDLLSAYHWPRVMKAARGSLEQTTDDGIATADKAPSSDASLQNFTPASAGIAGTSSTADGHPAGQGGGVSGGHGHGRGR